MNNYSGLNQAALKKVMQFHYKWLLHSGGLQSIFKKTDFGLSTISDMCFDKAVFNDCDFTKTIFLRCSFADAQFINCTFSNSKAINCINTDKLPESIEIVLNPILKPIQA